MRNIFSKLIFLVGSFIACSILAVTTGCASGGIKLTRSYAGWVNSQHIVLRIIIYILGIFIFVITLLVDVVINNSIDFWEGRVAAGKYEIKDGDKTFLVHHEYLPGTLLRRSTIQVINADKKLLQTVAFGETPSGEIEFFVDGKLRSKVSNISSLPVAAFYDANEKLLENKNLVFTNPLFGGTWARF